MRLIESTTIAGQSGKTYPMNIYPADMRFNDFIPGVFLLYADEQVLFLGDSDNVDAWLQRSDALGKLGDQGFSKIGFIKNGSPKVRASMVDDLGPAVSPALTEI